MKRVTKKKVFVGLSGGVDSSVAALRLIRDGYYVVGVFIKTWQPDFIACNWEKERLDAMRVAAHLNIPFLTCDAEKEYRDAVAAYMISEYKSGRTPNPDVMCNKYVKFDAFLNFALERGADKIATGHYAQVNSVDGIYKLYRGVDTNKDQTYFLWTLTQKQLSYTLFPVGDTPKKDVRKEAQTAGIPTFAKQDSQGVCFLGEIDMKDFLSHYIKSEEGDVLDENGKIIGSHDGALYYTMGQRHGFRVTASSSKSKPYFIIKKNLENNTLTVSESQQKIGSVAIELSELNILSATGPDACEAQFRYRQKPFNVHLEIKDETHGILTVQDKDVETPSIGQSCVFYNQNECLGGGTINVLI